MLLSLRINIISTINLPTYLFLLEKKKSFTYNFSIYILKKLVYIYIYIYIKEACDAREICCDLPFGSN
jgi:hypothetical protein